MLEALLALILISAVLMSGARRIKLLTQGFTLQALAIALVCVYLGFKTGGIHFYFLALLTLTVKVILIPYIIKKSTAALKSNRETQLIIGGLWSYILSGVSVMVVYGMLKNLEMPFLKVGVVLMLIGGMLMMGRKKAISQMIGFMVIENGLVLFELSMVEMSLLMEAGIVLEVLVLALIMGIMIFNINNTFDSINTDHLSNLKE